MESLFITSSGGVLSNQMIDSIYKEETRSEYFKAESYALKEETVDKKVLEENILTTWELLCVEWDKLSFDFDNQDIRKVRNRFIIPMFELLEYEPIQLNEPITMGDEGELKFPISHVSKDVIHIHIVSPKQKLDKKDERTRYSKRSPHDLMQQFLNSSEEKWGIVTNGKLVRLVKEHHLSYTKGYVEFNLAGMLESRNYKEFKVFYRLLHASRFKIEGENDNLTIMDRIYEQSVTTGSSIGSELKYNIKKAIEELGNGFLSGNIIEELQNNEEKCSQFYSELLIIIYRVMFLLFAEQRGLFPGTTCLYMEEYSITSLRNRVERGIPMRDEYTDIWEGLKVTFRMVEEGIPEQGIYAYNGMLFSKDSTVLLNTLKCRNKEFLKMIDYLTLFNKDGLIHRISYVDLGVEELGSIYEGLLDFSPRVVKEREVFRSEVFGIKQDIKVNENSFFLDPRGTMRKQSGSYYTRPELVDELIKSALMPVVEDRLKESKTLEEKEEALLKIKICDPACGSGHFLIAANNYLGVQLAKIRSESEYPSDKDISLAKRDVLIHCIYGVDINQMAVELAKVSLWINACVREYPLNFLDHHIKCGNSLIGATSELMREGILNEAFDRDDKEEKKWTAVLKSKNRTEKERFFEDAYDEIASTKIIKMSGEILEGRENTPEEVHLKTQYYKQLREDFSFKHLKFIYDMWVSTFYLELNEEINLIPTEEMFQRAKNNFNSIDEEIKKHINTIAKNYKFFHWEIEFPEVFQRENKGFDCILGNPPWEAVVLKEKEYFVFRDKKIFEASTSSKRKSLIDGLKLSNSNLYESFKLAVRDTKSSSNYIRKSKKYKKSAKGTLNTYAIFTDLARQLVASNGYLGIIIETGIATNSGTKELFNTFIENNNLVSIIDFENREKLFPIHSSFRFCLLTATGSDIKIDKAKMICYASNMNHLLEKERYFNLSPEEFRLINPESKTMPSCRNQYDKEILINVYNNSETLSSGYEKLTFKNIFHMSGDSNLFKSEKDLKLQGFKLDDNKIMKNDTLGKVYLPLYEAKLFHQYMFNFATFEGISEKDLKTGQNTNYIDNSIGIDSIKPRFWIDKNEVEGVYKNFKWNYNWTLGLRGITCATNERTSIASIMPRFGGGNSIGYITNINEWEAMTILFSINSIIFDYVSRMKVGGMNFNFWIAYQQPVITLKKLENSGYFEKVKENVLKLTYYHEILKPFANDLGYYGKPFKWSDSERLELQCELDAIAAKLYGVTGKELEYILETFPGVKRKDMDKYNCYKTKETILKYFSNLS